MHRCSAPRAARCAVLRLASARRPRAALTASSRRARARCHRAPPCACDARLAQTLVLLKLLVRNHDNLFVLAEIAHFSGIGFLLYKLTQVESCEGAPLTQAGPLA